MSRSQTAIAIDGQLEDWQHVTTEYRDTIGDTIHRDHPGYGDLLYKNDTGRNDLVLAKVAHDDTVVSFYIQTRDEITPHTDAHWMLLLLDTDQNTQTGWLGYDYVVNEQVIDETTTTLKSWLHGTWKTEARITYRVKANGLELSIPKHLINKQGKVLNLDFHWADNIEAFSDVSELGVNGDSAPNRRWNYRVEVTQ